MIVFSLKNFHGCPKKNNLINQAKNVCFKSFFLNQVIKVRQKMCL